MPPREQCRHIAAFRPSPPTPLANLPSASNHCRCHDTFRSHGPAGHENLNKKILEHRSLFSIAQRGVGVSVSALRTTTTPAHPAISLVRHRVRFAATSAALRSNAPAALKRLQRCGTARVAVGLSVIQGQAPPSAFGLRPVFPLCLPPAAIHPFLPKAVMKPACLSAAGFTPAPFYPTPVQ